MATKKKVRKNKPVSKKDKVEEIGIRELMLCNYEINSNELFSIEHNELKDLIDKNLSEMSYQVYRLDDDSLNQLENTNLLLDQKIFKYSGDKKINCKVIYNEENKLEKLTKNKIRIISWEELEVSNVSIELPDNINDIKCMISGNTFGCMDDWGFRTFTEYSFTSADKKLDIYFNSESYGEQKEKVAYFINSNGNCVSIRDLDYNDNFGDEMLEAFEELKMK